MSPNDTGTGKLFFCQCKRERGDYGEVNISCITRERCVVMTLSNSSGGNIGPRIGDRTRGEFLCGVMVLPPPPSSNEKISITRRYLASWKKERKTYP
jgi:hypothetical protein